MIFAVVPGVLACTILLLRFSSSAPLLTRTSTALTPQAQALIDLNSPVFDSEVTTILPEWSVESTSAAWADIFMISDSENSATDSVTVDSVSLSTENSATYSPSSSRDIGDDFTTASDILVQPITTSAETPPSQTAASAALSASAFAALTMIRTSLISSGQEIHPYSTLSRILSTQKPSRTVADGLTYLAKRMETKSQQGFFYQVSTTLISTTLQKIIHLRQMRQHFN